MGYKNAVDRKTITEEDWEKISEAMSPETKRLNEERLNELEGDIHEEEIPAVTTPQIRRPNRLKRNTRLPSKQALRTPIREIVPEPLPQPYRQVSFWETRTLGWWVKLWFWMVILGIVLGIIAAMIFG